MIALSVIVREKFSEQFAQMFSPNGTTFDRHSSRTERTNRSAYAFRFGLRAGNRTLLTLEAPSIVWNAAVTAGRDR